MYYLMSDSNELRTAWILSQPDKGLYYYLKYGANDYDEKLLKYYQDLSLFFKKKITNVIQNKISDVKDTSEYSFTDDIGMVDFTANEGFDSKDKLIQNFTAVTEDNNNNNNKNIEYSKIEIEESLFENKSVDPLGKGKKHNWSREIKEGLDDLLTIIGLEISKKDYLDIIGDIREFYNSKKVKKNDKNENTTRIFKMDLVFCIVGSVLVYIQTSIKKIKVKPVLGCVTMLDGYPLCDDEGKLGGVNYMMCVLTRYISTKVSLQSYHDGSIWMVIADLSEDIKKKFLMKFLKTYIKSPFW